MFCMFWHKQLGNHFAITAKHFKIEAFTGKAWKCRKKLALMSSLTQKRQQIQTNKLHVKASSRRRSIAIHFYKSEVGGNKKVGKAAASEIGSLHVGSARDWQGRVRKSFSLFADTIKRERESRSHISSRSFGAVLATKVHEALVEWTQPRGLI